MKLGSLWPPRHGFRRLAAEYYQRRNARVPWLGKDAVELLPDLLRGSDRCLEWGAGASTVWLSPKVRSLRSVEHDPRWYERARAELTAMGRDPGSVRLASIEPRDRPGESPYVRVIDEFEDGGLDLCLVDGEHRAACALAACEKLSSGGVLVIDDVHGILDHPTASPHSRQGLGPADADWARFSEVVDTWRLIWTSDGYSDTAFWIKP